MTMSEPVLPRDGDILCAVSGGADSMCLLHMIYSSGLNVTAAHYEHGIRGEESLRDARFVENWCREKGIECIIGHGDVPAFAREHGLSMEQAARQLRYRFLEKTAAEHGCNYIATAHNADDNVETVIFNLARGGGALGLKGIPQRRGIFIRPLLGMCRRDIEKYLEENNIPHIEDGTNASDDYSRNLIRHHVTPVLRRINPELHLAVARTARLLGDDEDCLGSMADKFVETYYDGESLPVEKLRRLHRAVSSRVIRRLCEGSLSYEHVQQALELLEGTELKYLDLPGQRLRREQGRLFFREREIISLPDRKLTAGQWVAIPELGLELLAEYGCKSGEVNGLFKTCRLKYENISSSVYCTGRKAGDKFRPAGRDCTKSLKSLFNEAGYTQAQRSRTLIFRDEKGILAVPGLGIDQRAMPGPEDAVLTIKIREI